jgi:hypothetical protein
MKKLTILGPDPFNRLPGAGPGTGIGTLFPDDAVLVTLPGIHATQRQDYLDFLTATRVAEGRPAPTSDELEAIRERAVDLMLPPGEVQIRPHPEAMGLAFAADDLLQTRVPKHQIHFLSAKDELVRQAIKERGEAWRICPVPRSEADIVAHIDRSRVSIAGPTVYYYNAGHGIRYLTCREFARLGSLDNESLAQQLAEIQRYCATTSRTRRPDVAFFLAGIALGPQDFAGCDFAAMSSSAIRCWHAEAARRFTAAVPRDLRDENPHNPAWRTCMFRHLTSGGADTVSDELLENVGPEFFLQIQWLPGARIENGELIFDSVFDDHERQPDDSDLNRLCDLRVRRFITNFIREFGMLEYVNVGVISDSIRHHGAPGEGHRAYIAEIKRPDCPRPVIRILRMVKWGVRERLDQNGADMLTAMRETESYLDYIFDRRLGCWQLGMQLPRPIHHRRMPETYDGPRAEYRGHTTWVHYFERDYIAGIATNKVPGTRLAESAFASAFARLLGEAAALNMVVGRMSAVPRRVIFDDGDEILIEDAQGVPAQIVVADHAGTFANCESDLETFAAAYAEPVNHRLEHLADPKGFACTYLAALADRMRRLQSGYRHHRGAFDTLFQHQPQEPGSVAWRWRHVLNRLDRTNPESLISAIRLHMSGPASDGARPAP